MKKRCFLRYPCGKLFELRIPISILGENGKITVILPEDDNYLEYAKKKFEINNLKVIEHETLDKVQYTSPPGFISLSHRLRSIH